MNNLRTEAIRKLGTTLGQASNLYPEIGKAGVSAELVHLCPGVQPRGRNVQTLQPRGQATAAAAAAAVAAATAAVAAAAVFAWIWYGNDGALSQAQQHQSTVNKGNSDIGTQQRRYIQKKQRRYLEKAKTFRKRKQLLLEWN